jgi:hypothetical protein
MLAPEAYLKITSVGIADPMGYVISVIMIMCSLGAMLLSALLLRGRDFATSQRGGGGLSRRRLGPVGNALAVGFVFVTLLIVLSPHIGIFLLSIATVWSFAVLPDAFTSDPERLRRFERGSTRLAQLARPFRPVAVVDRAAAYEQQVSGLRECGGAVGHRLPLRRRLRRLLLHTRRGNRGAHCVEHDGCRRIDDAPQHGRAEIGGRWRTHDRGSRTQSAWCDPWYG